MADSAAKPVRQEPALDACVAVEAHAALERQAIPTRADENLMVDARMHAQCPKVGSSSTLIELRYVQYTTYASTSSTNQKVAIRWYLGFYELDKYEPSRHGLVDGFCVAALKRTGPQWELYVDEVNYIHFVE